MNTLHPTFQRLCDTFGATSTAERANLPSTWQLGDHVRLVFPDNGILKGRIIKVAFTGQPDPRYDVEIAYGFYDEGRNETKYFRIHDVPQWFISYTQEDWDRLKDAERQEMSAKDKKS